MILKLARPNINVYDAAILSKIIFLSMHLLLWMNVMLDFICMDFVEVWGTEREQKCKMKIDVSNRIQTHARTAFES